MVRKTQQPRAATIRQRASSHCWMEVGRLLLSILKTKHSENDTWLLQVQLYHCAPTMCHAPTVCQCCAKYLQGAKQLHA